ncbi:hypothetical protein DFH09DRAFT_1413530 [Mycena vulgaris]|nr:hypothetical protein DFH09DRAFT_1413530 [Mycena vulgaris]
MYLLPQATSGAPKSENYTAKVPSGRLQLLPAARGMESSWMVQTEFPAGENMENQLEVKSLSQLWGGRRGKKSPSPSPSESLHQQNVFLYGSYGVPGGVWRYGCGCTPDTSYGHKNIQMLASVPHLLPLVTRYLLCSRLQAFLKSHQTPQAFLQALPAFTSPPSLQVFKHLNASQVLQRSLSSSATERLGILPSSGFPQASSPPPPSDPGDKPLAPILLRVLPDHHPPPPRVDSLDADLRKIRNRAGGNTQKLNKAFKVQCEVDDTISAAAANKATTIPTAATEMGGDPEEDLY